jgi:hypothetical protein
MDIEKIAKAIEADAGISNQTTVNITKTSIRLRLD